jgi:hypothetical protein
VTTAPLHTAGVALVLLLGRHRMARPRAIDRAAAAAASTHTIPTEPVAGAQTAPAESPVPA